MTDDAGPPASEPELPEREAVIETPEPEAPALEPEAPAPPLEPVAPGPPPPSVETTRRLLGASFDLLGRASDDMRRASFYIGLIMLLTAAPAAIALFGIEAVSIHKTEREMQRLDPAGVEAWQYLLLGLAYLGVVVAAVESRIMAVAILGAHLSGRPITIRQAVARSRMSFWRAIIASIIVLIPVSIAQAIVDGVFVGVLGEQTDISLISSALVAALVGAPFAYLLTGIVLGDVDPLEAMRRSFRVFRARKSAAALVAVFETIALLLVLLGLGAGLDIALRVFDALGLGLDAGPAGLALIAIGLTVGAFAVGTLIYTALALSIAPQVVMFVGLTRATFGLDHVRVGGDRDPAIHRPGARDFHWVTWGLRIGFGFGIVGLVAVLALLGR